ncbi:MAG: S8 family serine peptidase [Bacteroidota bacterium]|nr:S8 family serine peptidase [Bacteroidota bacterium]
MKKLLLAVIIALCPVVMIAQSSLPVYQDGKIWFRVKDDARINASLNENPLNLPIATLPFLEPVAKAHMVTKLSKPFFAAKNSNILQRTYLLEFSDYNSAQLIIDELKATGKIVYAERVPMDHSCLTPNDPSYGSQWHLATINASSAWNYFSTGSTIKIAIIDNAIDRGHQDLSGNLWVNAGEIASNGIDDDGNGYIDDINGYDVADNDNNPNPPNNSFDHGTHCAGISSAGSNNSTGIASIGYSCKLMCIKATGNSASASSVTNGYDGVVYAVSAGAEVISMSWGGTGSSTTAQNIITWASQQGVVLIAAAGNNNVSTMFYPAGYTECIAVAATSSNDAKASFSNYGSWIDISAPGNNIYSTLPSNGYGNLSGTSMACPLVAGLAGLMLSLNPLMTAADVRNCIQNNATNINAQNSSYIGQLGAGRIDANASMACVGATLNLAPVANFVANVTTVTAGGSVNFTNTSLYCYAGTTYAWTFPGGFPAASTAQTPPAITYNTAGTYNVSLTVTNGNGNNTYTATNYIVVTAATGCTKVNLPVPAGWTGVNYYTGASVGLDGWINGMNVYLDKEKAMYFDMSAQPYTILNNVWVAFGKSYSANPAKIVSVKVYDGTSGTPGAQIGTTINATMGQIMADVTGGFYTEYSFVNAPVTLPASKKFFVSVDLTNLQWQTGVHDTLSVVSNTAGQTTPSVIWEKQSDNLWYQYTTAGSWNLSASLYIHPFLTNANSVATFTQSATSVCEGGQILFDATGSTFEDTLLWYFPNGSPVISNNVTQNTLYNNAGSYQAILYIIGGGCHLFDSAFVNITVNPNPVVSVSATATSVCVGNSTTLTASGANTYVWSPPTFLSATTGPTTVSTPTSTITYNVQGTTTATGCSSDGTIQIDVLTNPSAVATASDTLVCESQPVIFDGSLSTSAGTFAWSFPGGTPSTSNASSATVTYAVAGTYTAQLIVTNSCEDDTVMSQTINVGCMGIDAVVMKDPYAFYNAMQQQIEITLPSSESAFTLNVFNSMGQIVYSVSTSNLKEVIGTSELASGVYTLQVVNGATSYSMKFLRE